MVRISPQRGSGGQGGGLIHATVACLSRTRRVASAAPTVPEPRQDYRLSGLFSLGDRVMIGRMPQYAPDRIDDVRLALRGLSPRMEVKN